MGENVPSLRSCHRPLPQSSLTNPWLLLLPCKGPFASCEPSFTADLPEGSGSASVLCHQVPSSRGAEVRPPRAQHALSAWALTRARVHSGSQGEALLLPRRPLGLGLGGAWSEAASRASRPTGFFPSHLSRQRGEPPTLPRSCLDFKSHPFPLSPCQALSNYRWPDDRARSD